MLIQLFPMEERKGKSVDQCNGGESDLEEESKLV